MISLNNCPICLQEYNNDSRPEMIICLSQHYICKPCAKLIAKEDSKCPFCRQKFSFHEIKSLRIVRSPLSLDQFRVVSGYNLKTGLCPSKHLSGRFTAHEDKTCNKCGHKSFAQWRCNTCRYIMCSNCSKTSHEDVCSSNEWTYDQQVLGCNVCGKNAKAGRRCKNCSMRICWKHDGTWPTFFGKLYKIISCKDK